jgi:hypothetical protein
VKSRRGSATVSEDSCFEVPLGQWLGKVKRRAGHPATSKPGDLPESNRQTSAENKKMHDRYSYTVFSFGALSIEPVALASARGVSFE